VFTKKRPLLFLIAIYTGIEPSTFFFGTSQYTYIFISILYNFWGTGLGTGVCFCMPFYAILCHFSAQKVSPKPAKIHYFIIVSC